MQKKRKALLTMVVIIITFLILSIAAIYLYKNWKASEYITGNMLSEGDLAPDFRAEFLAGDLFTLSDFKGKVVFLNFWATWCSPCIAEMPAMQELSEKYKDDVIFIAMNVAENTKKVQDFIDRERYTFYIALDNKGSINKELYPSHGLPYTLIIDRNGIITKTFLGGGSEMHDVFEDAIKQALR